LDRPADLDQTLKATAGSLRDFWDTELPRIYHRPFEDLVGRIQPKTKDSPPWTCNGERITYHDIRGNAFYCGGKNDDYIAYDAAYLMPRLNKSFGALTPAVVLAHEFGHAVQHRAEVNAPSVVIELQADCFAGAWVACAQTSASDPVTVDEAALDSSIGRSPCCGTNRERLRPTRRRTASASIASTRSRRVTSPAPTGARRSRTGTWS
jgi:hypothetical protein